MKPSPVRPLPIVWPEGEDIGGYSMLMLEWESIVADYEAEPLRPAMAWRYLAHHPAFWRRSDWGSILSAAWYDSIESGYDSSAGGDSCWMECKPNLWDGDLSDDELHAIAPSYPSRFIEVDEPTHDEALLVLASLVHERYGNDREFLKPPKSNPEGIWYG